MEIEGAGAARTKEDGRFEELAAMTRPQLNELAPSVGVDPNKHSRKDDLIAAILEAEEARTEDPGPDPEEPAPKVPERDKGPSGGRIHDPSWRALTPEQRSEALQLAKARFVYGAGSKESPAQTLKHAQQFVNQLRTMGLI